jgi:hypothetical protein
MTPAEGGISELLAATLDELLGLVGLPADVRAVLELLDELELDELELDELEPDELDPPLDDPLLLDEPDPDGAWTARGDVILGLRSMAMRLKIERARVARSMASRPSVAWRSCTCMAK